MMYGLLKRDLHWIKVALEKYPEIEKALIFGSRAMGNYKRGSDVDLAIKGKKISSSTVRGLHDALNEEYPLPYFFDVVHYDEITNSQFKKRIDTVGKIIPR